MRTGCICISCSLKTQPLPTGAGCGRHGRRSTLDTAVVMTAVTDASVVFTAGSLGGSTSSRMVLYCRWEGVKDKETNKKVSLST